MLDTFDLVKYVAACANNAQIGVVWMDEGGVPYCDGKNICVPKPHAGMTTEEVVLFKRAVAHETSHVKYTDFSVFKNVPMNATEKLVLNLIEDHRIDTLNDRKYAGDAMVTATSMAMYTKRIVEDDNKSDVLRNKIIPLFTWDLAARNELPNNVLMADELRTLLDETTIPIADKLFEYTDLIRQVRETEDPFLGTYTGAALAKRIAKEVFEDEGEPMPTQEEVKNGSGSGDGDDSGDDGKGDAQEGEEEGDASNPYHDHTGDGSKPPPGEKIGGGEGHGEGPYTPDPVVDLVDLTREKGSVNSAARSHLKVGFSNKVRTLLQIATRNRTVFAQKKGKLNNSSLHRIPVNMEGYSERVFKKKIYNKSLDTAVTLLIDCSGSMGWDDNIDHAAAGAAMMNDVFNNVLHVNTEVLGFTEWSEVHRIYQFKKFDGPKVSSEALVDKFSLASMSDNVDGESLLYAYNRIKGRKEARKIIIVLSDGQPSGGYGKGNIDQYTKDVIKFVEHSDVELYAIGIKHNCSRYYKNAVLVDNPKNLEAKLLEVLKNAIIN